MPARDIVIVRERPSPLADAERSFVDLALEEVRQKLLTRVPSFAGGGPSTPVSNLIVTASGSLVNALSVTISGSPVESVGAQSHDAQEFACHTLLERDLVFVGERPSPLTSVQKLPVSVSGFSGERPSPPVSMIPTQIDTSLIFQGY